MGVGNWIDSTVNVAIGFLLGRSAYGLTKLMTTALWPLAIIIPIIFLALWGFENWFSGTVDKLFPSGIKPANRPTRKPLARRLSLPFGFAIGVIVSWLGLGLHFLGPA